MLPVHTAEIFNLRTDDQVLDFMFSHPMVELTADLTPADSNVANLQTTKPKVPIQTLTDLRSEADAVGIPADELKIVKLKELKAIVLIEESTRAHSTDITTTGENTTENGNSRPQLTEIPNFQEANQVLTSIINQYPAYPSSYNNRAQLTQLLTLYITQYPEQFGELTGLQLTNGVAQIQKKVKFLQLSALSDLNQAIQLCYQLYPLFSPDGAKDLLVMYDKEAEMNARLEQQFIEANKGTPDQIFTPPPSNIIVPKVLPHALCQRAILHKLRGSEMLSFQDFKQAAALGSTMAKEELDEMNTIESLNRSTVFQMMKQCQLDLAKTATGYSQQLQQDGNNSNEKK